MAFYAGVQTGNWSTASTWNRVTNTPTIHATTNIATTTGGIFSATFTAPNTVNACTGVLVFLGSTANVTLTATLQQNSVDTAATVSIPLASTLINSWIYFRFPTPFVFTTTSAGAYRFKITTSASSPILAADAAGSNFGYLATDDRTGAPTSADDVIIAAPGMSPLITVTVDGSQVVGSGNLKEATPPTSARLLGYGIVLGTGGVIDWNRSADSTLTCKGSIVVAPNGYFQMGTVASPIPAGVTASLVMDMVTSGDHGLNVTTGGRGIIQGTPPTHRATKYVSGLGTAASPLITSTAVDWAVGTHIAILATSDSSTNYNETEYKYIITKNSPTSYVLSNTLGGAEAGLSFTHDNTAHIVNLTRNCVVRTTNTSLYTYLNFNGQSVTGYVDVDSLRIENGGHNNGAKYAVMVQNRCATDDVIAFRFDRQAFWFGNNILQSTHNWLVACAGIFATTSSTSGGLNLTTTRNKIFNDCYAFNNVGVGVTVQASSAVTFNRLIVNSSNSNNTSGIGGLYLNGSDVAVNFNQCESNANRHAGVILNGITDSTFTDFVCGGNGINQTSDLMVINGSYNTALFINSVFQSATLIGSYSLLAEGSKIRFHKLNQLENNHISYDPGGRKRSTGAGLTDTTVRTAGSLAVGLYPESLTLGQKFQFRVLARPNTVVSVPGFCWQNSTFVAEAGAYVTVELFLPGSSTPAATKTMTKTTSPTSNDAVFALAAYYSGVTNSYARVVVSAYGTAGSNCYVDDLFNGTNPITALDVWEEGEPSAIMFEQLGDAAAVLGVLTSTLTTPGTAGKALVDILDYVDSIPSDVWGGITTAAINKLADTLIRRSNANIEASADGEALSAQSLYGLIAQGTNRSKIVGTTLTVYRADKTTPLGTRTIGTSSTADPVTELTTN
jgi:hypothetical protein